MEKNPHEPSAFPRSIILTATAAMAGGTQLFEGAHLTGGTMRFCRESSKCRNYALFVGQIIKYALRIILGFGFVAIKRFLRGTFGDHTL